MKRKLGHRSACANPASQADSAKCHLTTWRRRKNVRIRVGTWYANLYRILPAVLRKHPSETLEPVRES